MAGYVLALDVGDKRVGMAVASRIARLAAPHGVLVRDPQTDIYARIAETAREVEADTIVVGLPRDMKGQETEQTKSAREFAQALEKTVTIPVVMQDESVTSVMAEERLKQRGKPYGKGDIDAEAAAIILEDYLSLALERTA